MRAPPWLIRWHRYCALAVLLFLFQAALSGSLLLYKKPLVRWVVAGGATLPSAYSREDVQRDLERLTVAGEPFRLKAPNTEEPYWSVNLPEGGLRLYAPVSLELYEDSLGLLKLLDLMRRLHFTLLSGTTGELLMFLVGLAMLFLLLGGAWMWWPSRRGFRWRWVLPARPRKRYWLIYHRHFGAIVLLPLLLLALTGSIMLQQKLTSVLVQAIQGQPATTAVERVGGQSLAPAILLRRAQARFPEAWLTYIRGEPAGSGVMEVRFRELGEWHANGRNRLRLDLRNGEVLGISRIDDASAGRRLLNQMYPLHSGYGLSGWYRLLLLLCSLGCLWLALTGAGSWWRRRALSKPA